MEGAVKEERIPDTERPLTGWDISWDGSGGGSLKALGAAGLKRANRESCTGGSYHCWAHHSLRYWGRVWVLRLGFWRSLWGGDWSWLCGKSLRG